MKKYLIGAGGLAVLHILDCDVLSWAVFAIAAAVVLSKIFPILMEGTK